MTIQSQPVRPPRNAPPPSRPTKEAPPSRWPFWLGFVLSFVLLTVVSIGLLLMSTGLNNIDLADLQNHEAAWTPPEIVPTSTPDPNLANVGSVGTAGQYAIGATLRNITDGAVFIRQTPGYLSKLESDKIGRIPSGGTVAIIGGPATVDELTWWHVRYQAGDGTLIEGWSAEATASGLQILGPAQ
ncbi:MAG: hypothetical protein KDE19_18885 [Caldilineaceae bacterium]|nr:hypothetical protein [Caldilineaceae bacterium]